MPELTSDYAQRTSIQAWRQFFGWSGGNFMSVLMFGALLVPTAEYPTGTLNRDGYETYGLVSSVLYFFRHPHFCNRHSQPHPTPCIATKTRYSRPDRHFQRIVPNFI
jgi:Na+/melibiose symporter and related transporters